jgi:hypothetical protein
MTDHILYQRIRKDDKFEHIITFNNLFDVNLAQEILRVIAKDNMKDGEKYSVMFAIPGGEDEKHT